MFWQEESDNEFFEIPEDVLDLAFPIHCSVLPVDHIHALHTAVSAALPWFDDEPLAALHPIHAADSGNGWMSAEDGNDEFFYPSRRTKLTLRLPSERIDDARALESQVLDLGGYPLTVKGGQVRKLSAETNLYSRYVASLEEQDEERFLRAMVEELRTLGVEARKLVCGKSHLIRTPGGPLHTRSLMIADINPHDGIEVQKHGLGPGRKLGCGVFTGHKGIGNIATAKR